MSQIPIILSARYCFLTPNWLSREKSGNRALMLRMSKMVRCTEKLFITKIIELEMLYTSGPSNISITLPIK